MSEDLQGWIENNDFDRIFDAFATLRARVAALEAEAAGLREGARLLVKTMETCHQCEATLLMEDGPIYCSESGCSYDCEEHEGPECIRISVLHANLKRLLAAEHPTTGGAK